MSKPLSKSSSASLNNTGMVVNEIPDLQEYKGDNWKLAEWGFSLGKMLIWYILKKRTSSFFIIVKT